jgi:hypothetical protein
MRKTPTGFSSKLAEIDGNVSWIFLIDAVFILKNIVIEKYFKESEG